MKKNLGKILFSFLALSCFFSFTFAVTQQQQSIINQLKAEGRSESGIRTALEDLGYNADELLGQTNRSTTNSYTYTSSYSNTQNSFSNTQQSILNQLRAEGRSEEEIRTALEDLGYDPDQYFQNSNGGLTYTSRNCKIYNIEYLEALGVYTSPNLINAEYFVNYDYFKRYIDSKNPQQSGCPTNDGWISTPYTDYSDSPDRYTAPNGKVYFINSQNGTYTSNELRNAKSFSSIVELKEYIRDRNPLIWMGVQNTSTSKSQANSFEKMYDYIMHGSAPETSDKPNDLVIYEEEQAIDYSDDAKKNRDVARKNDLSQIQTAIITAENEIGNLPGMEPENNIATQGISLDKIAATLESSGSIQDVPFDPISSNIVTGLGNAKGVGEYIYMVGKNKSKTGFALMAKTETANASNRLICDGDKNLDNGYITSTTDLNDIQYCTNRVKSNSCFRDNQGRINSQKCYYSDDSQFRYLLTY